MKLTLVKSALIICNLVTSVHVSHANSNHWVDPVRLCNANPNCKQDLSDSTSKHKGFSHFLIRKYNSNISVRCDGNGECRRMFPRGASEAIENLDQLFANK